MATKNKTSAPPNTRGFAVKKVLTEDNFGIGHHGWPNDWNSPYPVPYGSAGTWHGAGELPFGNANIELLNISMYNCGWTRSFYPAVNIIW
ncbi:MAG: hypothetical protein Q8R57_12695, partial [Bacteroidota bacterium]|nr:hypothetical protein [Bacteroidota bacterium]